MEVFVIGGVIVLVIAAISAIRWFREAQQRHDPPLPPLVIPVDRGNHELPRPLRPRARDEGVALPAPVQPPPRPAFHPPGELGVDDGAHDEENDGARYDDDSAMTIQIPIREEAAVQLLPGRLEVEEGEERGRDIRFLRPGGDGIPEITIGRSDGPPGRHVRLRAETVSRTHARLQYDNTRWKISNLSRTNPVIVNDQVLCRPDESRVLSDGDRIELGEVVLRFRER